MNRQEAQRKITDRFNNLICVDYVEDTREISYKDIKEIHEIIDEINRPVVPRFVADWFIENYKKYYYDNTLNILAHEMGELNGSQDLSEFEDWYINCEDTLLTLALMPYGYEVEESLYYVKFIDDHDFSYLNKLSSGEYNTASKLQNDEYKTQFTEAEIKAIDPRYWNFAVPV